MEANEFMFFIMNSMFFFLWALISFEYSASSSGPLVAKSGAVAALLYRTERESSFRFVSARVRSSSLTLDDPSDPFTV
jgi:hypothetical protein